MRIFIVEDNPSISSVYCRILQDAGHETDSTSNPLVAISKILRRSYDLLIIDLLLPDIRGDELMKRIRIAGVSAPIVIATNLGSGFDNEELLAMGADKVVLKSAIGPAELRDLVSQYETV